MRDHEYGMIDSTIVRRISTAPGTKKDGEDQAIGAAKAG